MFKNFTDPQDRATSRAFPGQKHALARAFQIKYDQNFGLCAEYGFPMMKLKNVLGKLIVLSM